MTERTLVSWSSGKDSAWALFKLQQDPTVEVAGLFCTVNREFSRVAMHGVRVELLARQAQSIGLPLQIIEIPFPCSNEEYEEIMARFVAAAKVDGVENFAFGDLFLEDIRQYREQKLKDSGIRPVFPIWGVPPEQLSREMIDGGLRALITCIDPKQAPAAILGKEYDKVFLDALPESVDPCGENGEFHSFVFDGPMFDAPIDVTVGQIRRRDEFVFVDVLPAS